MYKHIFFDLDRTFWDVDTNQRMALGKIYDLFDLKRWYPDSKEFYWIFRELNEKLWSQYSKGEIDGEYLRSQRFLRMLERVGVDDSRLAGRISERYVDISPRQNALLPGSVELLDYLSGKGYPLSLITNGFDRIQHRKILHSGIKDYFKYVVTSETAGYKKPDAAIFEYAASLAGVPVGECLMVGDDPLNDVDGPARAGMDTAYFNVSGERPEVRPTYEIRNLVELKDIL